jgi:endoglucanase
MRRRLFSSLLTAALVWGAAVITTGSAGAESAPTVQVAGNRLVDAAGRPVNLVGVNKAGTEYACSQGWGLHDGPIDDAGIALMATWRINAVRVPLNESCWLGVAGVAPAYAGEIYRAAVRGFVDRLHAAGMIAVLDLHLTSATRVANYPQDPMPNTTHSIAFWESVSAAYRDVPGVAFDLFNEPRDVSWACWRSGCDMPGGWRAAGMQQLIDAVRRGGSTAPVIVEGLGWGNDLSGWFSHPLRDPAGQLAAGFHVYQHSQCATRACWDATVGAVAASVPVVTTEFGQDDCGTAFTTDFMQWADGTDVSYLAWTWNDWEGCGGPVLLLDYSGTPSAMGEAVRSHYLARAEATTPPPDSDDTPPSEQEPTPPAEDPLPPPEEPAPGKKKDSGPSKGTKDKPTRAKAPSPGTAVTAVSTCTDGLEGRTRLERLEKRRTDVRLVVDGAPAGSRWRVVVRRDGAVAKRLTATANASGRVRVAAPVRAAWSVRMRAVARGPEQARCARSLRLGARTPRSG